MKENWTPVILASGPDPCGAFFENRSSIVWWDNPFVWALLLGGLAALVERLTRGCRHGR